MQSNEGEGRQPLPEDPWQYVENLAYWMDNSGDWCNVVNGLSGIVNDLPVVKPTEDFPLYAIRHFAEICLRELAKCPTDQTLACRASNALSPPTEAMLARIQERDGLTDAEMDSIRALTKPF